MISQHRLLRSVSTLITKGTTPTSVGGQFAERGPSFVKVESIRADGSIDRKKVAHITEETDLLLRRSRLAENDLLYSIAGTIGRVALVEASILPANTNQALAVIRPDTSKVVPRYLYFALRDSGRMADATARVVQSVQANLSLGELAELSLWVPDLPEQRAIAEVLGALDDKIAANAAIVRSVQELTRALFRASLASDLDQSRTFGDVATIGGGGTPSTRDDSFWDGDIKWSTPTDVTGLAGPYLFDTSRKITEQGLEGCASPLYPSGSILMTSRATIGAFAIAQAPVAVNQGFIVVQPRAEHMRWWLLHEMMDRVDEFKSVANGATFLELSRGRFKSMNVRLVSDSAARLFAARVSALHASGAQAVRESTMLANLRDTLLPQLMSGKLRVREAEKRVEEVM